MIAGELNKDKSIDNWGERLQRKVDEQAKAQPVDRATLRDLTAINGFWRIPMGAYYFWGIPPRLNLRLSQVMANPGEAEEGGIDVIPWPADC